MLKLKHTVMIATITFIFSLIFSAIIVQVTAGALTETRKSALIETLSGLQLEDGSFATPEFPNEGTVGATIDVLTVLKILNALDKVNTKKAVEYLVSQQDPDSGGFGKLLGYNNTFLGFDLYSTYGAVKVLRLLDALDRVNKTALVNFVLARYNWSDGGFHELTVEAFGRKYAISTFPIDFRTYLSKVAYANSNIISTFLGVSILSELGELNRINITRTLNFILSCKTNNGVFAPYPGASSEFQFLPGWSSLIRNPFNVDGSGGGIPYTYAAIGALKALGHLNLLTTEDRKKILEYLEICQENDTVYRGSDSSFGGFYIHKDDEKYHGYPRIYYTHQAVMILFYLDMLDEAEAIVSKAIFYVLNQQELLHDNSWPVPRGREYLKEVEFGKDWYGLFSGWLGCYVAGTYFAITILNATNNLKLLDELTPRAKVTIRNIIVLSFTISVATVIVVFAASIGISNLSKSTYC